MRAGRTRGLLLVGLTFLTTQPASAQEWRLGAQVGRIHYDGAAAVSATTGTSLALGVSRLSARDWFGATAGIPLEDQPLWLVTGLWKQWRGAGETGFGFDLSGHAFLQREVGAETLPLIPIADSSLDRSAEGAGAEAALLAFAGLGPVQLELRGGATAQVSSALDTRVRRLLPLVAARLGADVLPVQLSVEGRHWWDEDSAYTYAGATAQLTQGPVGFWASAGRWLEGGAEDAVFAAGATVALGERLQLEGSWREAAFDPLYNTTTARSFSLGMSVRVGGGGSVHAPIPALYEDGSATIRLPANAVQGTPRIAGDFTGWEPRPMMMRAGAWEYAVALAPGVYTYAFVDESGTWFVPESVPGRRSDGMGGHHAVLIVGST